MTDDGDFSAPSGGFAETQSSQKNSEVNAELEKRLASLWAASPASIGFSGHVNGEFLPGFRIRRLLGSGSFGIVYLADDLKGDRQVALKIPRPEVLLNTESRDRFFKEATLAAQLKHPGIVEVFQVELAGPIPYIAAAYCSGADLATWMHESPELPPWQDCVELLIKICDAVGHAHQQGVYHRDLKPANIVLATAVQAVDASQLTNFNPKITDFGLARLADSKLTTTRSSLLLGTPMYMAPEHLAPESKGGNEAARDIYSLGVIFFELITGQYPVRGESYFEVLENKRSQMPTRLRAIRQDLPRQLDKICRTCLQANPNARYSTAGDLSKDLRAVLDGLAVTGKRTSLLASLGYWCLRPERAATAGRFMVAHSLILAAWVFVVVGLSFQYGVVTWEEYGQQWRDALLITSINIVPSTWAGWQLLRGKRWPVWIGVIASVMNLPAMMIAILDKPRLFQGIYLDLHPFFAFTVHIMLLICTAIQLLLLICAIASMRKHSRPTG